MPSVRDRKKGLSEQAVSGVPPRVYCPVYRETIAATAGVATVITAPDGGVIYWMRFTTETNGSVPVTIWVTDPGASPAAVAGRPMGGLLGIIDNKGIFRFPDGVRRFFLKGLNFAVAVSTVTCGLEPLDAGDIVTGQDIVSTVSVASGSVTVTGTVATTSAGDVSEFTAVADVAATTEASVATFTPTGFQVVDLIAEKYTDAGETVRQNWNVADEIRLRHTGSAVNANQQTPGVVPASVAGTSLDFLVQEIAIPGASTYQVRFANADAAIRECRIRGKLRR